MHPYISIVLPVHNEAKSFPILLKELINVLEYRVKKPYEIIVVDDASTDGSSTIIKTFLYDHKEIALREHGSVRYICQPAKGGQAAAIMKGMELAIGDIIATMDADLEHDPCDIEPLLRVMASCDMVCGVRKNRTDGFLRKVCSVIANTFRNMITGDSLKDSGCTFRIMKKECLSSFAWIQGKLLGCEFFFFPLFAKKAGYTIKQYSINHRSRRFGKSNYHLISGRFMRGLVACFKALYLLDHKE